MMMTEETGISQTSLPIEAFKAHLRMGTGFSEESLQEAVLQGFLAAAISAIEAKTGKVLLRRGFRLKMRRWRDEQFQPLPVAPVTQIHRISLENEHGETDEISETVWKLEPDAVRPYLAPRRGALPVLPHNGSVEISFEAGYAASFETLPNDLAQAVMLLAAHYYENRSATELSSGCMPFGVTSLIERYKTIRIFAGGK